MIDAWRHASVGGETLRLAFVTMPVRGCRAGAVGLTARWRAWRAFAGAAKRRVNANGRPARRTPVDAIEPLT